MTVALQLYDYALTIQMEVSLIWCSAWSYTKVLFLLTRYLPIGGIFFLLYSAFNRQFDHGLL